VPNRTNYFVTVRVICGNSAYGMRKVRNDSNPVENLGFNEYRGRTCKLTIRKILKIQWRGLNPFNLSSGHASVGEGKEEDGRKCRNGGECGKEKEIKGKWSVYLQPVHVTG